VLNRYPHFGAEDKLVWDRWLKSLDPCAIGVDYDLRVGPGLPIDPNATAQMQRDWLLITQLRMDAVVYWPTETWIVEIKPRLLPSALGQLLSYGYYYAAQGIVGYPLKLVSIVGQTDPQLQPVLENYQVRVIVV
jgi:hypothetical protein